MQIKGLYKAAFVLAIATLALTACAPTVRVRKLKPAELLGTENSTITEALSRNVRNKKDTKTLTGQLNKQEENRRRRDTKK